MLLELLSLDAVLPNFSHSNPNLKFVVKSLVSAAYAKSSWGKNCSGWNAFLKFEECESIKSSWPLDIEVWRAFVIWCIDERNLSPSTIKSYLSSLRLAHTLQGLQSVKWFDDDFIALLLSGASNLSFPYKKSPTRRTMTLDLLMVLGHRLANCDWSKGSLIAFWCLCTVAFFTSARVGELLSGNELSFDPLSTLLWEDVLFKSDRIILHIKSPKSKNKEGDFLDVFKFPILSCCPFSGLLQLKSVQLESGIFAASLPVFRLPSGKCLTMAKVNSILKSLLEDLFIPGINSISCHSLRAGLPSCIFENVDCSPEFLVKNWGRWTSDCFKKYTRLKAKQKAKMYNQVCDSLNKMNIS